ncbi:hypothetical protein [Tenacibaculum sp. 190130A14a]
MIGICISSVFIFIKFQNAFLYSEEKIKTLIEFIFRTRNNYYTEVASKALYAEIHNKALKSDKTVEENSKDFEEDLLKTFEKISE